MIAGNPREFTSAELGVYRPVPGHETAYRAGWQAAAKKVLDKGERRRGRKRGLVLLGSGLALLAFGAVLYWITANTLHVGLLWAAVFGGGIVNVLLGLMALLTGSSDDNNV